MAKRRGKKRKPILFILEVFVLMLFIGGLWIYGQVTTRLDKIEEAKPETIIEDTGEIIINEKAEETLTGYTTYALFGIDHRDKNAALGSENSDTMIVACVNNDTKEVRLVSVYRDTLLNIGTDTYSKANAAYAYGGPTQAINMLNTNLDLNIQDYVTVDFNSLVTVIDCLGGLDIEMSYAEIVHMNNYCKETAEETEKTYEPIDPGPEPEDLEAMMGTYHLNGVQAVSYCRIRYTASLDMGRTERQRRVIKLCVDKAKTAGLTTIFKIMDEVFPMVKTSLSKTEILKLIPTMIGYKLENTAGFPVNYKFANVKGSVIVPTTLESNVMLIHDFLFGEKNYVVSDTVKATSEKINEIVGGEGALVDQAPVSSEDFENTADDSFIWQNGQQTTWDDVVDNVTGGGDTGSTDPGTTDPGTTDPGSGDGSFDDGTGGGDYVDPGTGGGDYVDPGTGGGDYVDPGTGGGDYVDPGTGGGDYVDPGTGGGDYVDPGTGGGDYVDPGAGDWSGGDDWSDGGDWSAESGGDVAVESAPEVSSDTSAEITE